eukprot:1515795-Amphidinium_carterae.1
MLRFFLRLVARGASRRGMPPILHSDLALSSMMSTVPAELSPRGPVSVLFPPVLKAVAVSYTHLRAHETEADL